VAAGSTETLSSSRWVQTITACLKDLVVLITMISFFMINILPGIPGKLNQGSYAVMTLHGLAGMIGLV
jgi:hypothetical protein